MLILVGTESQFSHENGPVPVGHPPTRSTYCAWSSRRYEPHPAHQPSVLSALGAFTTVKATCVGDG
jgi:hypothetical protein